MLYTILIILVCLVLEGFFSGSEIALISANKIKIRHKAEEGSMSARLIQKMFTKPEQLIGTTLVGTNLAAVIGSVVMTYFMVSRFGTEGEFYTILIMAPLILIFGEIIPKTLYQRKADTICYLVIIPIKAVSYLFFPIIFVIQNCSNLIIKIFYKGNNGKNPFVRKDELRLMVTMEKGSVDLKLAEKEMINRIFSFGDITAKEVMTPLVELMAMEKNSSIYEVISKAKREGYSRIPIFDGRIYNIIGITNSFDLLFLGADHKVTIPDIMKPVYYIPETKRIDDLLKELQRSGMHVAIVVNEYGGSTGMVTVEDILEEIVGEIEDEYDYDEKLFNKVDNDKYIIDARMEIDAINEQLKLALPKGSYETMAGLLLKKIERIPQKGEVIDYNNLRVTIEEADEKSIKKVCVSKI